MKIVLCLNISYHLGEAYIFYISLLLFSLGNMPAIWMKSLQTISWQRLKPWTLKTIKIHFNWKNPWVVVRKKSNVFILQAICRPKWIISGKENVKVIFHFIKRSLAFKVITEFQDTFPMNQAALVKCFSNLKLDLLRLTDIMVKECPTTTVVTFIQ